MDWVARCVLTASKLLHLEAKVSLQLGEIKGLGGYRHGIISLVFLGNDGGIHAQFACPQHPVGALDGSSGRFPSFRRLISSYVVVSKGARLRAMPPDEILGYS
jgi:hypothetical protein